MTAEIVWRIKAVIFRDNPAFFDTQYSAGYRILIITGYPAKGRYK
jgi:hypothetical protein